jgi:PadR family transcriptional regulator PadR
MTTRAEREAERLNWIAQLRKGWLELAILASLWQTRLYGLEIIRMLNDGADLLVSEGTLYPVLSRLHNDGLLNAEWVESDSGHPRKYYSLTAEGRRRTLAMATDSSHLLETMLTLIKPLLRETRR